MVSDPRCAAIARRLATPLRVAVSGRHGVGRSTVARALAQAGNLRGTITLTTSSAADVELHVLADAVKPEDRAAIGAARRPLLAVLNKADLIATTESGCHPHGPTTAARARCVQLSASAGTSIQPVVGILAFDGLDDALWSALRTLAGGHPVDAELRGRLMDTLDAFGVAQAGAAIRRGASRCDVVALLRSLSCIEVVARMMAGVDVVEAVGMDVDRGDTAAAHLRRAVHFQRYRRGAVAATHRACGADIVRGSLRLGTKVGGAV